MRHEGDVRLVRASMSMNMEASVLRDSWYIACASLELTETPVTRRILDEDWVLLRNAQGEVRAFLDRCCHRGYPISQASCVAGTLRCNYHGWQYDYDGRCVHIPSLACGRRIPESFRLARVPCTERDGFVWLWPGSAEPGLLRGVPGFAGSRWYRGSVEIACNYLDAMEVAFDESHVYFVHANHPSTATVSRHGMQESDWELRTTDSGCIAFYPTTQDDRESIDSATFRMEFTVPCDISFAARLPNGHVYRLYIHTVPVDPQHCRVEWMSTRFDASERAVITTEHAGIAPFMAEDKRVLERVARVYQRHGHQFECSVESDAATLLLRKIVRAVEEGRWPEAAGRRRQIVRVRGAGDPQNTSLARSAGRAAVSKTETKPLES